jgi:hypothetical protein
MERQINQSLSPADEAIHVPQRRHTSSTSMDENGVPADQDDAPFIPSPMHEPSRRLEQSPELETTENQYKWTRGEAVEEETYQRFAREFPTPAEELGDGKTIFEEILEDQLGKKESPWAPFAHKDEWELARWLAKNVNQRATEEFLKMSGVSFIYFQIEKN